MSKLRSLNRRVSRLMRAFSYYFYNSFLTHFPSYKVRTTYLRRVLGIEIGESTSIHMGCFFAGNNISIGDNTVVARNCYMDGRTFNGFITIKNNVSIAPDCCILSMSHDPNSPTFEGVCKDVVIEDYVWIGARAMILPGVIMGKGSVLGAASTATKSIPDFAIFAGSPAKEVGKRSQNLNYNLNYFPYFNTDI
jgi:acetyltransferase-like isoleucine patch superfamily enzyme